MMDRRQFLVTAGAAAVGSLSLSGTAAASHFDTQPEHVTIEFDRPTLERYRPMLNVTALEQLPTLWGWVARSPDHDTDVCVFWAEYGTQEGVTSFDSHWGDHEPCYVVVDDATGEVREVIPSVYHWLAGHFPSPPTDGDHPKLRVINPWHQYIPDPSADRLFDVHDFTTVFQAWLDNGLEEDLEPGVVVDPWLMRDRGHWWADFIGSFSPTASLLRAFRAAGAYRPGGLL